MTAVAGVAAATRLRSRSAVLPPAATVVVGTLVRWGLSRAVRRERPAPEQRLVSVHGPSYPSRHATAATLGALVLYRCLPESPLLTSILTAGVAAVCTSRLRLGVHWPSDVLAGVALATLVDLAVCSATSRSSRPPIPVAESQGGTL